MLDQFMSGKNLFGKGGAFAPMLKNVIEKALEAEMEGHLNEAQRTKGNKRNGKGKKTIKSGFGTFDIDTPQDRQSSFEPELVKKRQTILADNLSDKIIGLYGLGMSYRDISSHIKEMYDTDISHTVLSQITDRIIPDKSVAEPPVGTALLYRMARCHALQGQGGREDSPQGTL